MFINSLLKNIPFEGLTSFKKDKHKFLTSQEGDLGS